MAMGWRHRHGFSLSMVMVCAALAMATAFTVVAITTQHLRVVRQRSATQDALQLANQALAQAMSNLRANQSWGQMHTEALVVTADVDRRATVSFNQAIAPYSTNNFDGSQSAGWNGAVPPGQVELVALGESHGVQRVLDTLVTIPIFPYVLAVSGPLQVDGQLRALGPPSSDPSMVNGDPNYPASIASNTSLTLAGACLVTGDVVCPGTVSLPTDAVVDGTIRKHSVHLPAISGSRWDPRSNPNAVPLASALPDSLQLQEADYYSNSDVTVGSLTLDGSLLYVNGNLTVQGGITGRGTVIVAGRTQVGGATAVVGTDLVALVGAGDVTFASNTSETRFFQGLVYTQGNFSASNMTIVGSFMAAPRPNADTLPSMTLENVTAQYLPAAVQMSAATGLFGGSLVGNVYAATVSQASYSAGSFGADQLSPAPLPSNLLSLAQQQQNATQFPAGSVLVSTLGQVPYVETQGAPHAQAPTSPDGQMLMQQLVNAMSSDPYFSQFVHTNTSSGVQGVTLDEILLPGTPPVILQAEGIGYNPDTNQFFNITPPAVFSVSVNLSTGSAQYSTPSTFLAAAQAQGINGQAQLQSLLTGQATFVTLANQMLTQAARKNQVVNLSLNNFMQNGIPLKIVSWQELQ